MVILSYTLKVSKSKPQLWLWLWCSGQLSSAVHDLVLAGREEMLQRRNSNEQVKVTPADSFADRATGTVCPEELQSRVRGLRERTVAVRR